MLRENFKNLRMYYNNSPDECSNSSSSKAAASEGPKAYPLWYVEGLNDARTTHGKRRVSARRGWAGEKSGFFSSLVGE